MVTKIVCTLVLSVLLGASVSLAQFDLSKFGVGTTSAAPSPALSQLTAAKDLLANNYVQSTQNLTGTLGKLLGSMGGGADLLNKLSAAKNLQAGTVSTSGTSVLRQSVDMAGQMLKQKLQGTTASAPDIKQSVMANLPAFINGLSSLKNLVPQMGTVTQQAQNAFATAPLADKLKVQGVLSQLMPLAQSIPADFNSYKGILSTLLQYASSHNIQVPAAAANLLK